MTIRNRVHDRNQSFHFRNKPFNDNNKHPGIQLQKSTIQLQDKHILVLLLVAVVAELGEDVLPVAVGVLLLVALLLAAVIVLRRSLAGTILFISGCGGQHKLGSVISTPSATGSVHRLVLWHRLSTTTDMLLLVLMIFSRCHVQSGCVCVCSRGKAHGSSCCQKPFCGLDSRLLRSHL